MSSNQPNKNAALAINQKIVQGVEKHFAKLKKMSIAGVSYTPAALKTLFQGESDALVALDASRAQMTEQVASTRATRARVGVLRKQLRAYLLGNYGVEAVQVLEDFGMAAPKRRGPKTVRAVAAGVAKASATREARKEALRSVEERAERG